MRRRIRKFIKEVFRRKVVRVVIAYLSVYLATVMALTQLDEKIAKVGLNADRITDGVIVFGILAIPLVVYLAWRYDIVPPQFVRDINDVRSENPALSWARLRHEAGDAGFVLLSWTDGDGTKLEKRYFQPVSIGREIGNDIELGDERVSRHHAVLWAQDGVWHIRDLDSANGTFVGHARVSGVLPLPQSCELRFHISGPVVSVQVAKAAETRVS